MKDYEETMIAHVLNAFTRYVSLLFRILEGSVIRNQPGPFCERPVIEKFLEEGLFAFLAAEKLQVRFQLLSNTLRASPRKFQLPLFCSAQLAAAGKEEM